MYTSIWTFIYVYSTLSMLFPCRICTPSALLPHGVTTWTAMRVMTLRTMMTATTDGESDDSAGNDYSDGRGGGWRRTDSEQTTADAQRINRLRAPGYLAVPTSTCIHVYIHRFKYIDIYIYIHIYIYTIRI